MITVEFDDSVIQARLRDMPSKVRAALYKRVSALAVQLANKVRQKLSGEVLQVRSGDLRASINQEVLQTSSGVTARVFSSGDVKYAAIHEYGGTIPAHEILPNKAQALRFEVGGNVIFARRVWMPDVKMPERSFLRSSLAEMKADIVEGLTEAVREGMQ